MLYGLVARRSILLTLSLLTACGAAGVGDGGKGQGALTDRAAKAASPGQAAGEVPSGLFLAARMAGQSGDLQTATDLFLRALAQDPTSRELREQAFLSCLLTNRPEAETLARGQPDNAAAQLLLAGLEAQRGHWDRAEARFAALPQQGVTQALQPLLVAWAQYGGGHADVALATLRPYVAGQRFRGVYALHAAMIADLSERVGDAARLYHVAQVEYGPLNLALARALASWQARQNPGPAGDAAAAHTLAALAAASPDLQLALPSLRRHAADRQVRSATDGIAEVYLALAAALRAQDASEYAALLLHLALDLRPDLTGARLLSSEIMAASKHPDEALAVLAPIGPDDPIAPLIDERRAQLLDQLGRVPEAMQVLARMEQALPNRAEPWRLQGTLLRGAHRYDEAVAAYDQAVRRTPDPQSDDWPLFYERGVALERLHRWPAAEADLLHALQLQPDQANVLNYLGYSWADQGIQLTRAHEMILRAVAQHPNDGAMLDSLGWVMFRQGDTAGAIKELEHAAELDSEDAEMNGHLGDAYRAAGRRLEAYWQWQRALTLQPEADTVPVLRAKLKTVQAELGVPVATATQ